MSNVFQPGVAFLPLVLHPMKYDLMGTPVLRLKNESRSVARKATRILLTIFLKSPKIMN